MNHAMELMLESARAVLGDAGQIAPMSDSTARVTYAGGGFRLLDVGGFAATPPAQLPERIDRWVRQMLLVDGQLALPDNVLPVLWLARAVPADAIWRPVGEQLVEGVLLDEVPVTSTQAAAWGTSAETLTRHARTQLAQHAIQPERVPYGDALLTVLTQPAGSASGWALFPNLLKSVTGVDARQIVFLPDSSTCVVVAETRTGELEAAADYAAERFATADQPLSPVAWIRSGAELIRYPD